MGGSNQIIVFDHQIMHRRDRQVELQRLPGIAVVCSEVNTEFRAGKEQPFFKRVFMDCSNVCAAGYPVVDPGPILSKIARAVDVWADIIEPMTIDGSICRAGSKMRRFDDADLAPVRKS